MYGSLRHESGSFSRTKSSSPMVHGKTLCSVSVAMTTRGTGRDMFWVHSELYRLHRYCRKLWITWKEYRQTQTGENIPSIETMTHTELTHWLSRFVVEVRKVDGTEYPPNTLHHIVAGLQRHLRFKGNMVDLFKDQQPSRLAWMER